MTSVPTLNPQVDKLLQSYPEDVRGKLMGLRALIYEVAGEAGISDLVETLKWGEPSYVTRSGSTLRMDWKARAPEQYAMYFHCQTKLVETFRELFGDAFKYEGNRAILFSRREKPPRQMLKQCILLSLTYHKRKHLPLLGA